MFGHIRKCWYIQTFRHLDVYSDVAMWTCWCLQSSTEIISTHQTFHSAGSRSSSSTQTVFRGTAVEATIWSSSMTDGFQLWSARQSKAGRPKSCGSKSSMLPSRSVASRVRLGSRFWSGTITTCIPAARAAFTPLGASSNTKH